MQAEEEVSAIRPLAWTLLILPWVRQKKIYPALPRSVLYKKEIWIMLWTILVILLVLWLIGLLSNVGGGLIHLLLVVAVVVLIINLVTGRRAV